MLAPLLILIFFRPFVSSLAFPSLNFAISLAFLVCLLIFIIARGIDLEALRPLRYPLWLFCFSFIAAYLVSSHSPGAADALLTCGNGLFLFMVTASLRGDEKNSVIRILVFASVIISLLALYQYFFGFSRLLQYMRLRNLSDPFVTEYIGRRRVFFPFMTPTALGGYLAMSIPLTLTSKRRSWFTIPLSLALIFTQSLGALFSLLPALALYACLTVKLKKKHLLLLSGFLALVALVYLKRASHPAQQASPFFSITMRLHYWRDTLKLIAAHPFKGNGLGEFNLIQSRYAHNSYLQIFAETGIVGVLAFIFLAFKTLCIGYRKMKIQSLHFVGAGLIAASFAFLTGNLVDYGFFLPEVSMLWWAISGLIVSGQTR